MLRSASRFRLAVVTLVCAFIGAHAYSPHRSTPAVALVPNPPVNGAAGANALAIVRSAVVEPGRFVAIVAADIDADGDLDVVASDSSLQLHVWVNDGSGHFTTRRPQKQQAWRADPSPAFDVGSDRSESSTQTDPPVLRLAGRAVAQVLPISARACGQPLRSLHAAVLPSSGPRAPPALSI